MAAVAATLAAVGCGDDGYGDAARQVKSVEVESFTFRPARIEVPVGGSVVWKNLDKAKHTATAKEGSGSQFDTGTLRKGASRTVKFAEKGTFEYVCAFHAFMDGTVEVK